MTCKDILRVEEDYKGLKNVAIKNDYIRKVDIDIVGHFGNIPCLEFILDNRCIGGYNDVASLGYILNFITEFFEIDSENGVRLNEIRDLPVRLVAEDNGYGQVLAIGHFMKDKFFDVNLLHQLSER